MDENKPYNELSKEEQEEYIQRLHEILDSNPDYARIQEAIQNTPVIQEILTLFPAFLDALVDDLQTNKKLSTMKFGDAIKSPEFEEALQRIAAKLDEDAKRSGELSTPGVNIPSVAGKRVKNLTWPLDKVNATIWKLLEKDTGGQIVIAAEKHGSKKPINLYYSINFEDLSSSFTITRKLEPYDKRVYNATGSLWDAGNKIITLRQIYHAMGFDGEPGTSDLEKINASITKLSIAHIYLNNKEEAERYNYPLTEIDSSLLPMLRIRSTVNGQTVDGAIQLYCEPPLIGFARSRNQITTIERKLLSTPLNKTNQNLQIEDYLLERIAHAKRGSLSSKIKFKTIYEEAGITDKQQRHRAPAKIEKLLNYYKECGYIKDFTKEADGVRIKL